MSCLSSFLFTRISDNTGLINPNDREYYSFSINVTRLIKLRKKMRSWGKVNDVYLVTCWKNWTTMLQNYDLYCNKQLAWGAFCHVFIFQYPLMKRIWHYWILQTRNVPFIFRSFVMLHMGYRFFRLKDEHVKLKLI